MPIYLYYKAKLGIIMEDKRLTQKDGITYLTLEVSKMEPKDFLGIPRKEEQITDKENTPKDFVENVDSSVAKLTSLTDTRGNIDNVSDKMVKTYISYEAFKSCVIDNKGIIAILNNSEKHYYQFISREDFKCGWKDLALVGGIGDVGNKGPMGVKNYSDILGKPIKMKFEKEHSIDFKVPVLSLSMAVLFKKLTKNYDLPDSMKEEIDNDIKRLMAEEKNSERKGDRGDFIKRAKELYNSDLGDAGVLDSLKKAGNGYVKLELPNKTLKKAISDVRKEIDAKNDSEILKKKFS